MFSHAIEIFQDGPNQLGLLWPANDILGWDLVLLAGGGAFPAFGVYGLLEMRSVAERLIFFLMMGVIGSALWPVIWLAHVGAGSLVEFARAAGVVRIESTFFGALTDAEEEALADIESVDVQTSARGGLRLALITRDGDVILPFGITYTSDYGQYRARNAVRRFLGGP